MAISVFSIKEFIYDFSGVTNTLNLIKFLLNEGNYLFIFYFEFTVDDFIDDPNLKQFYMVDMNNLLTNYEPGKPEHKPKLMEQIKNMEEERNRRLADHNQMLEARKKMLLMNQKINTNTNIFYEEKIANYEKQIAEKVCLINELLKKIKELNIELTHYKSGTI